MYFFSKIEKLTSGIVEFVIGGRGQTSVLLLSLSDVVLLTIALKQENNVWVNLSNYTNFTYTIATDKFTRMAYTLAKPKKPMKPKMCRALGNFPSTCKSKKIMFLFNY